MDPQVHDGRSTSFSLQCLLIYSWKLYLHIWNKNKHQIMSGSIWYAVDACFVWQSSANYISIPRTTEFKGKKVATTSCTPWALVNDYELSGPDHTVKKAECQCTINSSNFELICRARQDLTPPRGSAQMLMYIYGFELFAKPIWIFLLEEMLRYYQ